MKSLPGIVFGTFFFLLGSQVNAAVMFFPNDVAGFLAAMAGNTSLGTEDFEGSTLGPVSTVALDDPLTQGVASSPDATYPTGLSLPLTVQSNLSGGTPTNPNPRGVAGLAALSAGFLGAASDVVVAGSLGDSLDWIFSNSDNIVGVGFDSLVFLGEGASVDVRVYNTGNTLLGMQSIAADAGGTNFLGIQATGSNFIGRINFFAPGGGAESGDNAQLFSAAVPEPVTLALLGLGLAGIGYQRRRSRKAA